MVGFRFLVASPPNAGLGIEEEEAIADPWKTEVARAGRLMLGPQKLEQGFGAHSSIIVIRSPRNFFSSERSELPTEPGT